MSRIASLVRFPGGARVRKYQQGTVLGQGSSGPRVGETGQEGVEDGDNWQPKRNLPLTEVVHGLF